MKDDARRSLNRPQWRASVVDALVIAGAALVLALVVNAQIVRAIGAALPEVVNRLILTVDAAIAITAAVLVAIAVIVRRRRALLIRRLTLMVEHALALDFGGHVLAADAGDLGRLATITNQLVDKYRKATKRRAREKDRLTTVLTHMASGAMILSETGSVRLINEPATQLLQTTASKALRLSFVQVVRDHRIAEVWLRSRESGAEETEAVELPPDRFVRVTVTPFVGGDASGYLVFLHDLSAVRRLEKVRRDFVSNVSHELRTPLASLHALVDTLRDGALDDPPAAQRFLDRIEVEVDKMTQLVQELLELSRIESGQAPLRLNPASIESIVRPAVERLQTQAERAGVSLQADLPDNLPGVLVDLERIQAVVINLVHNAIKFTPEGGRVEVSAHRDAEDKGFAVIEVRDTGIGIPRDDQARVFERFYKSDRSRSSSGTGLGLAIAKHTVQAHGGRIWLESEEDVGSTLFFTLPTHVDEIDQGAEDASTGMAASASPGSLYAPPR